MAPLTFEQVCKRAGGRRRYNRQRQVAAEQRRAQVRELLARYGRKGRGTQARIARELGVSEATVSRDVRDILFWQWATEHPAAALRKLYGWPK